MSNFFEHTPQATDVVSQVENLATEVSDAFDKVETILHQDNQKNASINSSIGDLDNKYIKEYLKKEKITLIKLFVDQYFKELSLKDKFKIIFRKFIN